MTGKALYDGQDVRTIQADAVIETKTLNTRAQKHDDHPRSPDFFDAERFPTMTFKSKRVEVASAGKFQLIGDLTIRGVSRKVVFDVEGPSAQFTDQNGATRLGALATARINCQDYSVS